MTRPAGKWTTPRVVDRGAGLPQSRQRGRAPQPHADALEDRERLDVDRLTLGIVMSHCTCTVTWGSHSPPSSPLAFSTARPALAP